MGNQNYISFFIIANRICTMSESIIQEIKVVEKKMDLWSIVIQNKAETNMA